MSTHPTPSSTAPTIWRLISVGSVVVACGGTGKDSASGPAEPHLQDDLVQVVPGDGLPASVVVQPSANNLDIVEHDGAWFFAFRTAPNHFASAETELHVLRSTDRETWSHETTLFLATDLREPRFLSSGDTLQLYFAKLGTSSTSFEPGGALVTTRSPDGTWSEPADLFDAGDTFIPWRTRWVGDRAMMTGYRSGSEVYEFDGLPSIEVYWLGSTDGSTWHDWTAGSGPVLVGGGSETDLAFTNDGAAIAVVRNEAGDEVGWGSKICRAEADALDRWTCTHDPRKYDSPLVFAHGGRIWLIGRRNLTETGAYDLEMRDLDHAAQSLTYQAAYWNEPKRCSLWEVDAQALTVSHVLDLPSRGDTCFASILPLGGDRFEVWNYSSPVDGPDVSWVEGQTGETFIYKQTLVIPSEGVP
ncbi:MAG: hypothetical protein CL927_09765 [Deltaproteobacteria bacterium]|nr:hypothetical protein [Deltaproteobacteria bacterium]HCH66400.1 hypothetical protein [Deltaproteobacteria bacterium]